MFGKGLLKGLSISLKHLFGKAITQQYPEVKPKLPPRAREFFDFSLDKCTACGVCAKTCPNNVIQIESIRDEDKKRKLTKYKIELGLCLFCGLCVEVCPTGALNFTSHFERSKYTREEIVCDFLAKGEEAH